MYNIQGYCNVVFMVVMSRGGDGTLKGDTSGHYNLHILPSGQQTVDAVKYGREVNSLFRLEKEYT